MGLLSDPSLGTRSKLGRTLAKHTGKICLLFYVIGLAWFVCLAHSDFNHSTYLSENALSPGLVYPEVKQDTVRLAQSLYEELRREREDQKSTAPYAWLVAKMNQIGLETHVHNFTLRYPFAGGKEYHGKNVYGILRAPRVSSTEGIVFSTPYRAHTSIHIDISAGVAILLAFADFARRKNYWAKDLVFLVTEQEQLGMHAWLEAYYGGGIQDSSILQCGNLPARAGALQAALNLEIQDLDYDYIDVKIEGLNGQLPNLDMFNLVQRITAREGISSGYKQGQRKKRSTFHSTLKENLKHMTSMIVSQASGVPNGNHGLFHRYRIEALTLEAVKRSTSSSSNSRNSATWALLKTVEGISRSLNNLLERFHQSYFFYILVQNDRFVSIGDFIPCLILLTSPMFIKSCLLWLTLDSDESENIGKGTKRSAGLPFAAVLLFVGVSAVLGVLCNLIPLNSYVREYSNSLDISTATSVSVLLAAIVVLAVLFPFVVTPTDGNLELLHVGALLFLGVALVVVGLLNFALGFLLAIICTPMTILLTTAPKASYRRSLSRIYVLLLNPLVVVYSIVLVFTLSQFPELALAELLMRATGAAMDAITFALMDCIIYGNWLYMVITAVFFPLWTLFWILALSRRAAVATAPRVQLKEKTI